MFLDKTPLMTKSRERMYAERDKSHTVGSKNYATRRQKIEELIYIGTPEECWYLKSLQDRYKKATNCGTIMWRNKDTDEKHSCPARQAVYEEFVGEIPPFHRLMSKCQVIACVNYHHMELEEFGAKFDTPEEKAYHMLVKGHPDECWSMKNRTHDRHPYISWPIEPGRTGPLSARTLIYNYFKVEPQGHLTISMKCDNLFCVNPAHMQGKV